VIPAFHHPHFSAGPPTANVQIQIQPTTEMPPQIRIPWRPLETVTCFKVILSTSLVYFEVENNSPMYNFIYVLNSAERRVIMQIRYVQLSLLYFIVF
jgi:hypothetical protein